MPGGGPEAPRGELARVGARVERDRGRAGDRVAAARGPSRASVAAGGAGARPRSHLGAGFGRRRGMDAWAGRGIRPGGARRRRRPGARGRRARARRGSRARTRWTACQNASWRTSDCRRMEPPEPLLRERDELLAVPSHERVHELRLAPGRDRRERGRRSRARRGFASRPSSRPRGPGWKARGREKGGGGGGGAVSEEGGARKPGSRARVREATPRTALSIDTTLVVYRCRSASVRSMAPSRRRCNPRQRRLLPGPAPTVAEDE